MEPKREPRWSPRASPRGSPRGSQDGAKKEKKNEVKLREARNATGRVMGGHPGVVTRPLEEGRGDQDQPKSPPNSPKRPQNPPKRLQDRPKKPPRPSQSNLFSIVLNYHYSGKKA